MPDIRLDPALTVHYEDDCYADPWRPVEAVLLIHGVAESGRAWYGWVPHLAAAMRVLRPDLRGFGQSTPPPAGYEWSPANFAADLARFLDALDVDRVHVVGAKLGGSVALQFAADYPERVRTLAVFSGPVLRQPGSALDRRIAENIRAKGLRAWAAETQRDRLGSAASEEQIAWWTDFMAAANPRVCEEVTAVAGRLDITAALPRITAPSLIVTTSGSVLQSVDFVREHQGRIANSELVVLPGDSYHIAAASPDECARLTLAHIAKQRAAGGNAPVSSAG